MARTSARNGAGASKTQGNVRRVRELGSRLKDFNRIFADFDENNDEVKVNADQR